MKRLLYIIPFLLLFAAACTEDPVEPQTQDDGSGIALSVTTLSFLNTGEAVDGAASVTVTSNADWTLIGKDDWCHPSVTEGKNGESVIFTADANPGAESRTAEFFFVSGSKTEKLYVMQKQNSVIELFKDEFDLPREGGDIAVRVSANDEVTVNIPADYPWITMMETPASKSLDLNVFYFHIEETDEYEQRNGRIEFLSGGNTVPATISQDRKIELKVDNDTYNVSDTGDEIQVKISTNLPYEVEFPESASTWLEYIPDESATETPDGLVERVETFRVLVDRENASRATQIKIKSTDDNDLTSSFVVVQRGTSPVTVNIPDPNFRQALAGLAYVITVGYEGNECEISAEGMQATSLDVSGKGISDLTGIEYFENLTLLNCQDNNIRKLDLSKTKIDVKYVSWGDKTIIDGNPYEEIYLNDASNTLDLAVSATGHGLTGADGSTPTAIKIVGAGLNYVYLAQNTSLKTINLYNCASIPGTMYCSFTGMTDCTVYLNPKTPKNFDVEGVTFKWENPEQ